MNRLASPAFIVPRIRRTNYHDAEETSYLSGLLRFVLGRSLIGQCRVPLGQSEDYLYTISPCASLIQVEAKIADYKKLGFGHVLASEHFFCIEKCPINEASRSPWGGCPPLEPSGHIAEPRKVSGKSDKSADSGYASGREADRSANPESRNIEKLAIDYEELTARCFYTLGILKWQHVTGGRVHSSDYIIAVSLYDSSIWAIYDAWDNHEETQATDEELDEAVYEPEPSFRPALSENWGRLPGLGSSRQVMIRIAENAQTYCFEKYERIEWRICKGDWSSADVPLFLPARQGSDGKVKPLFESILNAEVRVQRPCLKLNSRAHSCLRTNSLVSQQG